MTRDPTKLLTAANTLTATLAFAPFTPYVILST